MSRRCWCRRTCPDGTYQQLAAGFGGGVATVYRYVCEVIDLLAVQAPPLIAALWALAWSFNTFASLDDSVVCTDRLRGANN